MKILWVVNLVLPKAAPLIGERTIPFGGWITNMLNELCLQPDIKLSVVMRAPITNMVTDTIDDITYYIIPQNRNDPYDVYQKDCNYVLESVQPDILHVEGSESAQAKRFLNCWHGNNVVSMQGILNGYEQYELGGINGNSRTLIGLCKNYFDIFLLKLNKVLKFNSRLTHERETLALAKNILGRTHWDRSHSYFLNRSAPYFECARILRPGFYQSKWDISKTKKHRIFIGNSAQARKGAHFVLAAVDLLKNEYPDIEVLITGENPFSNEKKKWKNKVGYRSFLKNKISELNLQEYVRFTGVVQEKEMIEYLCSSHVFVLSSVIENSPNTLGEAMMLGVPTISAYMGGVSDMAQDGTESLFYRSDDPVLLAMRIKQIFDSKELALTLSINGRDRALKNHSVEDNCQKLLAAYGAIIKQGEGEC